MLSIISLLFFTTSIFSQTLSGVLFERGTKKALSNVNVFLLPQKLKSVTDDKGNFNFKEPTFIPNNQCEIIVNLTGYKKFQQSYPCSDLKKLTIYLEKQSYTNFETTVTGKVKKRDLNTQTLTQEEFIKTPGSFGGDPVRAAQNLPGVAQNGASAQIIIQGANPEDTGYLINGHRVPIVFHFGGLSSVIIPEAVERVDLLPSGYGPEYSRAIGGIVGLTTSVPKENRIQGMAYIDFLNTGALLQGPIDQKSSFLFAGRYSYIGQVLKAVAKESDDLELTAAPTYYDMTGIYSRKINDKNNFKTTLVASRDQLELILNQAARNDPGLRGSFYNRTEFYRFIPQLETRLSSQLKLENSIALGKDSILVDVGGNYLDVNSNVLSHRSEAEYQWNSRSVSYLGLDNIFNQGTVRVNLPSTYNVGGVRNPFSTGEEKKFSQDFSESQLGVYLRQEHKFFEASNWTFLPNLRFDHFTITDDSVLQPRFQTNYKWDDSLVFRTSLGKYVQAPRPQETSPYYGNPSLRSPFSWHYTIGFTKDLRGDSSNGFELTNNYFFKELKDLVVPDIQNNFSNEGSGKILGAEIQSKFKFNEWSSQIVYTYLQSERRIPGFGTRPSEFDQTHNLNLIGSYNLERWSFSARFRYVTGNPYTPVVDSVYDSDNDVYLPVRGSLYSERFSAFNQLDIRVDRKFIFDTWILTAYLDVQNLYNSKNEQSIEYAYDFSQSKKVRGLPILPTFGIKGEF